VAAPDLTDRLDRLEGFWRDAGAPLYEVLAPGLDDGTIMSLAGELGLTLPDEARQWWRWHNGVVAGTDWRARQLTRGYSILSLSEALDECQQMRREFGNDDFIAWQHWWLPFGRAASGALICFDCSEPARAESPILVRDWHMDQESPRPVTNSLAATLDVWIDLYETGAIWFDPTSRRWTLEFELVPMNVRVNGLAL
jgi:cell wall assembly regulator SMI1